MYFYVCHFETNDYNRLFDFEFCYHINSNKPTVHLHGEFDEDIFLHYWFMNFLCHNTYRQIDWELNNLRFTSINIYFDVLNLVPEYSTRVRGHPCIQWIWLLKLLVWRSFSSGNSYLNHLEKYKMSKYNNLNGVFLTVCRKRGSNVNPNIIIVYFFTKQNFILKQGKISLPRYLVE